MRDLRARAFGKAVGQVALDRLLPGERFARAGREHGVVGVGRQVQVHVPEIPALVVPGVQLLNLGDVRPAQRPHTAGAPLRISPPASRERADHKNRHQRAQSPHGSSSSFEYPR